MRPAAPERKKHTKSIVTAGDGGWLYPAEELAVFRGVAGDCGVKGRFRETRFIVSIQGEEGQLPVHCPHPSRRAFSHTQFDGALLRSHSPRHETFRGGFTFMGS